jgi:hypothetical protein
MFAWIWQYVREGRIGWLICGSRRESTGATRMHQASPSLHSPLLPALLLVSVAAPGFGAERAAVDAWPAASAVLQRFIANQEGASGWPLETVEIEASLPKLKKTGWLRAIRRVVPAEKPHYEVLEIAGDRTVKNQLIARYISANERATELPASSLAITPENYEIHYAGSVCVGDRPAYAFRIIPRKRREGLINAVLWLDSETGLAVRESGYLAKNPSVFLKRVNLTRENELHNGTIAARVTHILVETRLAGPAQLVIVERPTSDELTAGHAAAEGK